METKKYLLIAEKPSLMKEIQKCYNNHKSDVVSHLGAEIDFMALSGHVCTNCAPDDYKEWKDKKWREINYPMLPDPWQIKAINDEGKQNTIARIKKNLPSYYGVICATDSDTEGYGIYYLLEKYLNIKKPTLRFIEHSLTDKEILKSLLSMTDIHKDPQHIKTTQSFLLRSHADWLYGMNASRAMTVKQGRICKIGRVKSPTIKLVYDNSVAIENFKASKYYVVLSEYDGFKATLLDGKEDARFEDKAKIPFFPLEGEVTNIKSEKAFRNPPKLFDLAAVQAEAGSKFKYKPDRTLEIIQSLYMTHKVISYPRTQCRFISSEKAKELPQLLEMTKVFDDLEKLVSTLTNDDIKRVMSDKNVVNDTEVNKESHDALLPTTNKPDLSSMTEEEKNICHLIFSRLVMQFLGREEAEKTTVIIRHGKGDFKADGKIVNRKGWTLLYKEQKDVILPSLKKGDKVTAVKIAPDERKTKAPARLTQATLINAMRNIATQIKDPALKKSLAESQGIGTPATRAAIIKDIIDTGYVKDQKDGLYITDEGKAYIATVGELDIISPVFAAEMDTSIKKIQRGEATYEDAKDKVVSKLHDMVKQIESLKSVAAAGTAQSETSISCPKCGEKLIASKFSYECKSGCGFKAGKEILGHTLSEAELSNLIKGEKIGPYSFKNKAGKEFSARLMLDEEKKVSFDFSEGIGIKCPSCGKDSIKLNSHGAFCKCGLEIFRKQRGITLTDRNIKSLLDGKEVRSDKFKKKDAKGNYAGDSYSGKLSVKDGKLQFEFVRKRKGKE